MSVVDVANTPDDAPYFYSAIRHVSHPPYWVEGPHRVWNGDARQLPLPAESVHLIVTSPPYNAKIRYRGYRDWRSWENYWDDLIVPSLAEMYRVLVPGGRVCINFANILRAKDTGGPGGRNRPAYVRDWGVFTETVLWPALIAAGFMPRERITWIKSDSTDTIAPSTAWGSWCSPSNPVIRPVAEPIFIASKGRYDRYSGVPSELSPDDFMAWTRNVWFIPQEPHAVNPFPARFPVELARRLVKLYSFRYDTVLDPYMGSGTAVIAAAGEERIGVGVDTVPYYCDMAHKRYTRIYGVS